MTYYDEDMANLIADADHKEVMQIVTAENAEAAAEQDYMEQLAAARYAEQNGSPAGYEQDL